MEAENPWNDLDAALTLKATRTATLVRLNELFLKRFGSDGSLTENNCEVWRESLTADQLQRCNPGHDRAEPKQMTGPIIVFERDAERYMFDGTNCLNVWLRDNDQKHHDVIVIKQR